MKVALALVALLAAAQPPRPRRRPLTPRDRDPLPRAQRRRAAAWLLLPSHYGGWPIPLVISPHGRGVGAAENADLWGDLPGEGNFAVINPAGEGRRTNYYSWGDPGEISDLARMPAIVRSHGVHVSRVYAIGGSMGGQETLLLVARHPHLLAGAVAFDPATDMARRYRDFAALRDGRWLQRIARREIGGTPASDPRAYALRSPDDYVRQIAFSGVPLQLFWSRADRIISDQAEETGALADRSSTCIPARGSGTSTATGCTPPRCARCAAYRARLRGSGCCRGRRSRRSIRLRRRLRR